MLLPSCATLHPVAQRQPSLVPRLLFTERARKMRSGNETNANPGRNLEGMHFVRNTSNTEVADYDIKGLQKLVVEPEAVS